MTSLRLAILTLSLTQTLCWTPQGVVLEIPQAQAIKLDLVRQPQ